MTHDASSANRLFYDQTAATYLDGAPHLKHRTLRRLYESLLQSVVKAAGEGRDQVEALDLGSGEGEATIPLLVAGARVVAIDISEGQLALLRTKCARHSSALEVIAADADTAVRTLLHGRQFDLVVTNSFLHHIPDYIDFVSRCTALVRPGGYFFSFQDPMRYDSVSRLASAVGFVSYYAWRVVRGDFWGGVRRYVRRRRGVYLEDSVEDNTEYHVVRNGVDHDALLELLAAKGFEADLKTYFSTQPASGQWLGERMRLENTFALIARRAPLKQ